MIVVSKSNPQLSTQAKIFFGGFESLCPFNNLKKEDQILTIVYFAVEIGCYASDLDAKSYEKVPPPELNEIEENYSDSKFDDIFNDPS